MDYSLYKTINGLSGSSFADGLFKLFANDLPAVLVVLVALIFLFPDPCEALLRSRPSASRTASGLRSEPL